MSSSDEYKSQIMKDLSGGDPEVLSDESASSTDYQNFDDFAQRSSRDERHQLFKNFLHPDRVSSSQMEPELQKAIAQIKPNEQGEVAKEFFNHFKKKGLKERDLENQLGLSTHDSHKMTADDVSKLASFAYHNYSDVFQNVLADQPALVRFFSNPLIGAALGAVAAKWIGGHK
jgi:hypothetical protein